MLDVADVIQENAVVAVELGQGVWQAQVALGGQQLLHQRGRRRPQYRVAEQHQFVPNGRQGMAFADARFASGDQIDRVVEEGAAAQALELFADEWRELLKLQGAEGLIGWQARETLQTSNAMLFALQALGTDQLVQEGFVGQVGLGGFERQVLVQRGNGWHSQVAQHQPHLRLAISHGRPPDRADDRTDQNRARES